MFSQHKQVQYFLSLKVPKCSTARVHQYLLTYQYVCLICIISSFTFFFLLSISVYHKLASYASVQENNTEYIVKIWQKLYASERYCKGNTIMKLQLHASLSKFLFSYKRYFPASSKCLLDAAEKKFKKSIPE